MNEMATGPEQDGQLVFDKVAGERRGLGFRCRLAVYARP
jgi:hypothetical protein